MLNVITYITNKLGMTATKAKVASNLVWAVGGKVVTLIGNLIVGIFVARYLGPEQYGLMNYVISFVALFQVFASFGLDGIEIREEAKDPEKRDVIVGTAFFLRLITASITVTAITITLCLFEADHYTRVMIMLYSLSVIFSSMSVARNYFTSIVWNEYVVKSEISRTFVGIVIKTILLLLHASLTWFVVALLFDTVLLASGYAISYQKKIASVKLWCWDSKTATYLLSQAFPMLLSGAAVIVYTKINQVMLGNMLDKTAVGQYSIAVSFIDVCVFIPTILSQTVSPVLVKCFELDKKIYKQKAQVFMNLTFWVCLFIAIFVSVVSYPLIRYTYGTMYLAAIPVLQLMIFRLAGVAFTQTSGQMIIIEHTQKYAVIRNVIGCVVCISMNLVFIPRFGIMGAALSSIITSMFPGYFAHAIIPAYREIFKMQTRGILLGWKDIIHINKILTR